MRGFTLIEVLVSVALMAVIMALVQGISSQVIRSKLQVEAYDNVYHKGRVAMRKVADDVSGAFLIKKNPTLPITPEAFLAAPAVKTVPRPVTFFIGDDGGDQDQIRLTTLSHLRRVRNAKESDQAKIEYRLVPSEATANAFALVRTENPWLDDRTELDGKALALADGVLKFNLEYYDVTKEEWVKEWDTEKLDWSERLPSAVRISFEFVDPQNEEEGIAMSTGVFLPLAARPIDF